MPQPRDNRDLFRVALAALTASIRDNDDDAALILDQLDDDELRPALRTTIIAAAALLQGRADIAGTSTDELVATAQRLLLTIADDQETLP